MNAEADLFGNQSIIRSAVISPCELYRPELRRVWDASLALLVACMLNPSTGDAECDDPTILTLIHFARFWGFGGLLIINRYPYRTSKPAELFAVDASTRNGGPENELTIGRALRYARENGGWMLVAWGNGGQEGAHFLVEMIACQGVTMKCLGTTQSGAPKHPMARGIHRIPRDQQPILWRAA